MHTACIRHEITRTCVASPELVTFHVKMHSSHPHSSIDVSLSSDD